MRRVGRSIPTILVVEDDWLVRTAISAFLQSADCLVLEAVSGEQAIALLREDQRIDVVFTDIRLNGDLNGWDVGEAARSIRADIPVIYTSGRTIEPSRRVDGSLFFEKPYDPGAVLSACRKLREAG